MKLTITEVRGRVGVITLAHDAKRNALSQALIAELIEELDHFTSARVRAVVLRARAGAKVWSAGHDVNELPRSGHDPLAYNDPLEQGVRTIRAFPAPVVAMIDGAVFGGAVELALACDVLIGTANATFTLTPAKYGVAYNPAGILRLMSAVGATHVLREMFFTAKPLTAKRALDIGVLSEIVEPDQLEHRTLQVAEEITELSPLSIQVIKEQMRLLSDAHPLSPDTFERIQALRRCAYDGTDYREGLAAFTEKRKPVYSGE